MDSDGITLPLEQGKVLLEGLLAKGVGIEHECGGKLACATCRVIVRAGSEYLDAPTEEELDMLERAGAMAPEARLACQAAGSGGAVLLEIPARVPAPVPAMPDRVLPVTLTENAARHFAAQLGKHPGAAAVRLSVEPSGCSGFGYRVDPAVEILTDDVVFESHGIRIAVDPQSLPRVHGTKLDVVQDGLSRRLRFDNPNATGRCGCGESFAA